MVKIARIINNMPTIKAAATMKKNRECHPFL
jgi:hypothetical protein